MNFSDQQQDSKFEFMAKTKMEKRLNFGDIELYWPQYIKVIFT